MKILRKHLRNSVFVIAIFHTLFFGCDKQPEKKNYIARVNDSYLTKEELSNLDSLFKGSFSRAELIDKWVDKELLFQQAEKLGITEDEEFLSVINNSRRELASSMLMNLHFNENISKPSELELYEYYTNHKNEFKAEIETYQINYASFSDEVEAIKFRAKLLKNDWKKLLENYSKNEKLKDVKTEKTLSKYEIYPIELLNLLELLHPGEISIVLKENSNKYSIVQLLQVYERGAILPISAIHEKVEARYIADRREHLYSEYLKELYSNNEIEIKQ